MMPTSVCWVWLCVEPSAFILGENFSKRAVKLGSYLSAIFCHAWPRVCVCVCVCLCVHADIHFLCHMHFVEPRWFSPMPEKADPPFSAAENTEYQVISAASVGPWNLPSLAAGLSSLVWYVGWPSWVREMFIPARNDGLVLRDVSSTQKRVSLPRSY